MRVEKLTTVVTLKNSCLSCWEIYCGQLHDSNFLRLKEMYSKFLAPFKLQLQTSLPCASIGIRGERQLQLFTKAFERIYANYSPKVIQQCIPPLFAIGQLF